MAREEAEYKREKAKTKKVLLLGTSSAGKTTVLKQMKLKWRANGFGDERESYCRSIRENLVGSLKRIFHSFAVLNYDVPLEISVLVLNIYAVIVCVCVFIYIYNACLWLRDVGTSKVVCFSSE
jgi:hypothetical protein